MKRLNYRHLWYFWHVAREGGMTAASKVLHVSQPALSSQVKKLEKALGEELFHRSGRGLVLTEVGRMVFEYAGEIFELGDRLKEAVAGADTDGPLRLSVGIVEAFPKILAHHIIAPALAAFEHLTLRIDTAPPDRLFQQLATHDLDLVIYDAQLPATVDVRAYSHELGESTITIAGTADLAERYKGGFPGSLDGAPFLMPGPDTTLRRTLRRWMADTGIEPRVVAEVEDSAILKTFGREGVGLFAIPTVVEAEVSRMYETVPLGVLPTVVERFWAISVERRIRNPAVAVIAQAAQRDLLVSNGSS
ncbi:MAG TPA: LysR family transcriptional regulator [Longimicrobiales bacterium]|nr:LysR family transcriptional regulator [Longimicrobiales bacterium]